MASNIVSTLTLTDAKVYGGKKQTKLIGKVRSFVFYPKEKRIAGFIVKRPDLLWMFHRPDLFVAFDGYFLEEKHVILTEEPASNGKGAIKRLDLDWDNCTMWIGMPAMTEGGQNLGTVRAADFNMATGKVQSIEVSKSAAGQAIMGKLTIPSKLVKGFKLGQGVAISEYGAPDNPDAVEILAAIIVDDEAAALDTEGGLADKAGKATAVAEHKVKQATEAAKPVVKKATKAAGKAINKGAYATGKQIGKTKHMFSDFASEFKKASK